MGVGVGGMALDGIAMLAFATADAIADGGAVGGEMLQPAETRASTGTAIATMDVLRVGITSHPSTRTRCQKTEISGRWAGA